MPTRYIRGIYTLYQMLTTETGTLTKLRRPTRPNMLERVIFVSICGISSRLARVSEREREREREREMDEVWWGEDVRTSLDRVDEVKLLD